MKMPNFASSYHGGKGRLSASKRRIIYQNKTEDEIDMLAIGKPDIMSCFFANWPPSVM